MRYGLGLPLALTKSLECPPDTPGEARFLILCFRTSSSSETPSFVGLIWCSNVPLLLLFRPSLVGEAIHVGSAEFAF